MGDAEDPRLRLLRPSREFRPELELIEEEAEPAPVPSPAAKLAKIRQAAGSSPPPLIGGGKTEAARGYNRRGAREAEKVSEQRMGPLRSCMMGLCGGGKPDVLCRGCPERPDCDSGAHAVHLGLTAGQVAQNIYRCLACRLARLGVV